MNGRQIFGLLLLSLVPGVTAWCQLSGTKTIGGASPDYATFTDAVNALHTLGVSDSVLFVVRPGAYNEQLLIHAITGASDTKTITFQGVSAAQCTVWYASTVYDTNYVLRIDGGRYLRFRNLTFQEQGTQYSRVMLLTSGAADLEFSNDTFLGYANANGASEGHAIVYCQDQGAYDISFNGNTFWYGGFAINVSGGGAHGHVQGIEVRDNIFFSNKYAAIHLHEADNCLVTGNTIVDATGYGIWGRMYGTSRITGNRVTTRHRGIELDASTGSVSPGLLVANNSIIVTGGDYGILLNSCGSIRIVYNTIQLNSVYPSTTALDVASSNTISVLNNIIVCPDDGRAFVANPSTGVVACDYNDLYTAGNLLAWWGSTGADTVIAYDLGELQTGSGTNAHSVSLDPVFLADTLLVPTSPWVNGIGTPIADVTTDITGASRDMAHPDIGAYEFTPAPSTPLSGEYSIGIGGTYADIASAVRDITFRGVSSSVTFNILPGSYVCHETLIHIPGSSKENTVTFQSSSHDTGDVELTYSAVSEDDNYIVRILGGDNFIFKNLTFHPTGALFAHAVTMYGSADSLTFQDNLFVGHYVPDAQYRTTLLYSLEAQARSRLITGNTFRSAGFGIDIDDQLITTAGTIIENNVFENIGYTAIWIRGLEDLTVAGNRVNQAPAYGFAVWDAHGVVTIQKNILSCGYGGIAVHTSSGTLTAPIDVRNNVVLIDNGMVSDAHGIVISSVSYANLYHNTVSMNGGPSGSPALKITSSSSHIRVYNNLLAHRGMGTVYFTDFTFAGDPVEASDYNDYYTPGNYVGYYGSEWVRDLNDLRSKTGRDLHSLSVYPGFLADTDLHAASPWLDNRAMPGTGVTDDIEGRTRSLTAPDIGAYEFSSDPSKTPLSGVLTVGPGGDIPDLATAAQELSLRGISGSLALRLLDGIHAGNVTFVSAPGASSDRTVTIESQSSNPWSAAVTYAATGGTDNYVLRLLGADHFRIRKLGLSATGSTYARVLHLRGGVDSLEIDGNVFNGKAGASSNEQAELLLADSSGHRSRLITNNVFLNGSYGFSEDDPMYSMPRSERLTASKNQFTATGSYGLHVGAQKMLTVEGNTLDSCAKGISVESCDSLLRIVGNRVDAQGGGGIELSSVNGSTQFPALVANNFVHVGGISTARGISVYTTHDVDIFHNSVHLTATNVNLGIAFYQIGSSPNLRLQNNIFANTGGGYALSASTPADIIASDYNDLYAVGTNLAHWTTDHSTLSSLQATSGMDLHSLSVNPQFTSVTDLHTASPQLNGKALFVPSVTLDIDRQKRNPNGPDIGADEYRIGPSTAPQLVNPIPDLSYPEDSGQHLVADLRTVIIDSDPDDALAFTASISTGEIFLLLCNDSLFVNCPPDKYDTAGVHIQATDLDGLTATDDFVVRYTPVNDPPVARDDSAVTTVNTPVTVSVLRNDFDIEGSMVLLWAVGSVSHGTVGINAGDTTLTYQPEAGYVGSDSCFYVITDGAGGFDTATVRISVLSVFSAVATPFDSISHCSAAWGDYDGDGDMDLAIAGLRTAPNLRYSQIYRSVPGGYNVYSLYPGLQPNKEQGLTWIDLDGDGDLDLAMAGVQSQSVTNRTILYEDRMGTMTEVTTGLPGIWGGALAWADYDNDGDPDLLITGSTDVGVHISRIYRNDGRGASNTWTFTDINAGLPPIWQSSAAWGDFDKDGDPDFVITGVNSSGTLFSRIYRNDAGVFVDTGAPLVPVFNGSAAWADFDNDGDLDLLITGDKGSSDPVALLYRNDNGTFTQVTTSLRGVSASSVAWGDYDGDGDPDVLIAGQDTTGAYITRLYNSEAGQFGTAFHTFPGVTWGTVALVDFDGDGDLDPFVAGYTEDGKRVVTLYRNNLPVSNSPPEPPVVRGTSSILTDWTLYWHPATDRETPPGGLTYNVRVGTEPGLSDVVAAMSLPAGTRMVPAMGNAGKDTLRILHNLRQGKLYYWAVQSVDPSYAGSPFSTEQHFSVWHNAFSEVYSGLPNRLTSACVLGDYSRDGKLDVALAGSWPTLGTGNAEIYIRASGDFRATTTSLPQVSSPAMAWGDYDNDGDLDLAIAGSLSSGGTSRIYRNDPGGFVDIAAPLSSTHDGSVAWGDYDNDGDLDLLITGNWTTKLYRNNGGTFVDVDGGFLQLLKSSAEWGDYDRDGDLDLLLTGQSPTSGTPIMNSRVYRNNNGTFTDVNAGLQGVKSGTGVWADYDNDGDLDILIAGDMGTGSPNVPFTALYRNDAGSFALVQTPFDSVHHASAAWADYDNDGRLDLVLCGDTLWWGQGGPVTRIFRNTGSGFVAIDHPVIPMSDGGVAWGSIFDPGRLDLLLTGGGWTKLYWNRSQTSNTPPGIPTDLQAIYRDSLMLLRWSRSSDAETPRAALTYNIRIGTTRGGSQIISAMSDSTGLRVIPARGNAGTDTVHFIKGLIRGKRYYWTVQAVDNGYRGSPFATEVSFIYGFSAWNPRRWQLAKPIADFQATMDTLVMSAAIVNGASPLKKTTSDRSVTDVTVTIDSVYHTADGDLEFTLSHAGVTDTLIYRAGGSEDNFLGTTLSDDAATAIASGTAPFAGEFRPFSPLAKFRGTDPEGEWILAIRDAATGNTGVLQGWGLDIFYETATGTREEKTIPDQFIVFQNFPNPFNPSTEIRFGLPQSDQVTVTVFNLLGQKVSEPVNERLAAGYHSISFDGKNLASGVYVYRVHAGGNVGTRKMILVK